MSTGPVYPIPRMRIQVKEGKEFLANADEVFDALEKNPFWMQFAWLRYMVRTNDEFIAGSIMCSERFTEWATGTYQKMDRLSKLLNEFEESIKEEKDENLSLSAISARHLSRLDKK